MPILDRLKQELDRAGKAAQDAFDEGKIRLDAFRERQLADKAAQALGYAVFRAKQGGAELDIETRDRLSTTLATHDAEASRLEGELETRRQAKAAETASTTSSASPSSAEPTPPPAPGSTTSSSDTYQGAPS